MPLRLLITAFYAVKFLCHVLLRFRPLIDAALNDAETASVITHDQHVQVSAWFDGATSVCTILTAIVE